MQALTLKIPSLSADGPFLDAMVVPDLQRTLPVNLDLVRRETESEGSLVETSIEHSLTSLGDALAESELAAILEDLRRDPELVLFASGRPPELVREPLAISLELLRSLSG